MLDYLGGLEHSLLFQCSFPFPYPESCIFMSSSSSFSVKGKSRLVKLKLSKAEHRNFEIAKGFPSQNYNYLLKWDKRKSVWILVCNLFLSTTFLPKTTTTITKQPTNM